MSNHKYHWHLMIIFLQTDTYIRSTAVKMNTAVICFHHSSMSYCTSQILSFETELPCRCHGKNNYFHSLPSCINDTTSIMRSQRDNVLQAVSQISHILDKCYA